MVALQVVTVGQEATERFDRLQNAGDYTEAYFAHGLASKPPKPRLIIFTNISVASWVSTPEQGKRYSWGYPAIPDLEDHTKVFQLLPAGSELGMKLTTGLPARPRTVDRCDHRSPP